MAFNLFIAIRTTRDHIMKKMIFLFIAAIPVLAFAQPRFGSVKLGMYDASSTGPGFIIGYEGGWHIDNNLIIGWSADWFHKSYVDESLVSELNDFYGPNSTLNELRAQTNVHAIPLMGTATASWPIAPRAKAYITGSAGVEVLLIFYSNYDNPQNDDFHGAYDFAWRLGGGLAYELGFRSDAIVELSYTNSQPGWQYKVTDYNTGRTRVFERRFDMSGVMMRVGFRFYF